MDGFLSKPVGIDALGRVLRDHLPDTALTAATPAPVVVRSQPVVALGGRAGRAVTAPTLDTSRLDELAEMGSGAFPLIQRAIDHFVDGVGDAVEELRAGLADGDAPTLRSHAHRLKGAASNLGALRVVELARHLEELAEDGQLEDAGEVLGQLATALAEAAIALGDYRLEGSAEGAAFSA